jgi:predicted NBD/HSP70 family sugar kinase
MLFERPATTSDVSASNAVRVLDALYRRDEAVSVPELAREVALSRPTTEKALATLVANSVVERGTDARGRTGRPVLLYRMDRALGAVVGIDVGPTSLRVRVDDLRGASSGDDGLALCELADGETLTRDASARRRLSALDELVRAALGEARIDSHDVWAVAAASPGIIDNSGSIVHCTVMDDWADSVLRDHLRGLFVRASDVTVENDANLAAVAEHTLGAARAGDVAVISIGRGLGLGLLRDGVLHRGAHGQAGDLAHVPGSPWATLDATIRTADPLAPENRADFLDQLRRGLHDLAFTLDPELIVLAGPVGSACGPFLGDLLPESSVRFPAMPTVALSTLGRRGPLLGACELARREAQRRLRALATATSPLEPR